MRRVTQAAVTLLVWALPHIAAAERPNSELAAEHFQRGLTHAQANEIDAAALEFEAAYQASPHFAVLYNLGRTYAAMGRPVEAVDAFTRFLADAGSSIDQKRRTEVAASIDLNEKRIGEVELEAEPADAKLQIDGNFLAGASHILRLVAGTHSLFVSAPGYRSHMQAFTVEPHALTQIRARLQEDTPKPPSTVWLSISCAVPGVAVFADDLPRGKTPLFAPISLTAESHRIVFRRAGYSQGTFDWSPSQAAELDCGVEPASALGADTATLVVSPSPADTQVLIDGTRQTKSALPFGTHRLELKRFGFQPWATEVELGRGETKRLTVTMIPEGNYADEHLRRIRDQHLVGYGLLGTGGTFVITAGVLTLLSARAYNDWRRSVDTLNRVPSTDPNYQAMQHDVSQQSLRIRTLDDWGLSSAIAGTVLVISGAALLLTSEDAKRYEVPLPRVVTNGLTLEWQHAF